MIGNKAVVSGACQLLTVWTILAHVPDVLGLVSIGACHTLEACLFLLVAEQPGPAGSSLEQHHTAGWAWEKHHGMDGMLAPSAPMFCVVLV